MKAEHSIFLQSNIHFSEVRLKNCSTFNTFLHIMGRFVNFFITIIILLGFTVYLKRILNISLFFINECANFPPNMR